MDILVFGAGAVGGYLGAHLAHAGHKVCLVTRRTTADAIERSGLTVFEERKQITANPTLVPTLRVAFEGKAHYDLILVTVKAYDAQAALYEMIAFCPSTPTILTCQNGIGIEKIFTNEFGVDRVVAGSLTTPLSQETANKIVVEHANRGLALAPTNADSDISNWVNLFNNAGIDTVGFKKYQPMKWSKALLNMIGNATSAILNRHPKLVYSYEPTFNLEMEMLKEALTVMKAKKLSVVDLPGVSTSRLSLAVRRLPKAVTKPILTNIIGSGRGNKMPSFHLDLMSGREQNEVTFHNGAVAQAGEDLGIPTPVNKALNDILISIARKEIDFQEFNGQPKKLVAAIEEYKKNN